MEKREKREKERKRERERATDNFSRGNGKRSKDCTTSSPL